MKFKATFKCWLNSTHFNPIISLGLISLESLPVHNVADFPVSTLVLTEGTVAAQQVRWDLNPLPQFWSGSPGYQISRLKLIPSKPRTLFGRWWKMMFLHENMLMNSRELLAVILQNQPLDITIIWKDCRDTDRNFCPQNFSGQVVI